MEMPELPLPCLMVNITKFRKRNNNPRENSNFGGEQVDKDDENDEIYPLWSGKQIFSLIIPNEINMKKKSNGSPG